MQVYLIRLAELSVDEYRENRIAWQSDRALKLYPERPEFGILA